MRYESLFKLSLEMGDIRQCTTIQERIDDLLDLNPSSKSEIIISAKQMNEMSEEELMKIASSRLSNGTSKLPGE